MHAVPCCAHDVTSYHRDARVSTEPCGCAFSHPQSTPGRAFTSYNVNAASPALTAATSSSATCTTFCQSNQCLYHPITPGACEYGISYGDTSYTRGRVSGAQPSPHSLPSSQTLLMPLPNQHGHTHAFSTAMSVHSFSHSCNSLCDVNPSQASYATMLPH